MAAYGICYIGTDGISVAHTASFEAEDLAEALILARMDPDRPMRGSYSDMQVRSNGCLLFCGDPAKPDHRDAPNARCSTGVAVAYEPSQVA